MPVPAPTPIAPVGGAPTITAFQLAGGNPHNHHHGRQSRTGNPPGWSTGWNKGFGLMPGSITLSGPVQALYARAYDAESPGADPGVIGSGALVQDTVQVSGPLRAGVQPVVIQWPASPDLQYIELSASADFSNPVRLPRRVAMGVQIGVTTRSSNCGLGLAYSQNTPGSSPPDLSVIVPYRKGMTLVSGDPRYAAAGKDFTLQDGVADYLLKTTGAMELARIIASREGVTCSLIGMTAGGGGFAEHNDPQHAQTIGRATTNTMDALGAGCKLEYFIYAVTGANNPVGQVSLAQYERYIAGLVGSLRAKFGPQLVVALTSTVGFGLFDGSNPRHWGRQANLARKLFETSGDAITVVKDAADDNGNWSNSGHATTLSKVLQARGWGRLLLSNGRNTRGPVLARTGRWVSDYVVEIGFTHHGGSSLHARKSIENKFGDGVRSISFTETVATPHEATQTIALRLAGNCYTRGRPDARSKPWPAFDYAKADGVAVQLARVEIDNARRVLVLVLDGTIPGSIKFIDGTSMRLPQAKSLGFSAHTDTDCELMFPPGCGISITLVDDQASPDIPYGMQMRSAYDIYVPPLTPGRQQLGAIAPVAPASPGSWVKVGGGPGSGLWASDGFGLSVNGAALATVAAAVRQDNSWECWTRLPQAGAQIAVTRAGQTAPDSTGSVPIQAFRSLHALPQGCVFAWSARDGLYQDPAGTREVDGNMQDVRCWVDQAGGNRWVQSGAGNVAPALDLTAASGTDYTTKPITVYKEHCPAVLFEAGQKLVLAEGAPLLASLAGDFTLILAAWFQNSYGPARPYLQLGGPGAIRIYDNYGHTFVARGANVVDTFPVFSNMQGKLNKLVVRYRAADGLLQVFRGGVAAAAAGTVAPEPLAMAGGGVLDLPWGGLFYLWGAATFCTDAEKDAAMAQLTRELT